MFHVPRNEILVQRAQILQKIRQFFRDREILEVDTPILCPTVGTAPYLTPFEVIASNQKKYYLQTSPEFGMKRLLAAGSGPIFQLCKAFRDEEMGRLHRPEFMMLEWYRPGFDHHALMDETEALLQEILACSGPMLRYTYRDLFLCYLGWDPHPASALQIIEQLPVLGLGAGLENLNKSDALNVIMTHILEPKLVDLGAGAPVFIYDYPIEQAELAKIKGQVAERFEVYYQGIELANGYHELTDAVEQAQRFTADNQLRVRLNKPEIPIDYALLEGLSSGTFPEPCAGVALGVDRLIMLAMNQTCL
jgi:lysyl-tRNA synthetase class 2